MFKWGSPKSRGGLAEDRALRHLQQQGLQLIERNYRVAAGPHAHPSEVDLNLREQDSPLVSSKCAPAPARLMAARQPASHRPSDLIYTT